MASHFHLSGLVLARFCFHQFSITDSKNVEEGVHCINFSESFQIDPNSNEYLLAKFGFDTAENEPYYFVSSSSREFEFEL